MTNPLCAWSLSVYVTTVAPACGTANPPENKFCGQCAGPLRTTSTAKFASPDSYTPKHLAEKILTSKSALEGERKQVTGIQFIHVAAIDTAYR